MSNKTNINCATLKLCSRNAYHNATHTAAVASEIPAVELSGGSARDPDTGLCHKCGNVVFFGYDAVYIGKWLTISSKTWIFTDATFHVLTVMSILSSTM
jgi:hypothetical protein